MVKKIKEWLKLKWWRNKKIFHFGTYTSGDGYTTACGKHKDGHYFSRFLKEVNCKECLKILKKAHSEGYEISMKKMRK